MSNTSKFPITRQGFEKLEAEIKTLKNKKRPEIILAIAEAKKVYEKRADSVYQLLPVLFIDLPFKSSTVDLPAP